MVDRDSQQKLYVQLYSILRKLIEKGEWANGMKIPTEDELCRAYGVSKATVRIAMAELAREGLLKRLQGKGTFVTYQEPALGLNMRTRLSEDMFGEGVEVKRVLVARRVQEPLSDVKSYLGQEGPIYFILCKKMVRAVPVYLEEFYLPLHLIPEIEGEEVCLNSFFEFLQAKTGRRVSKVVQTIEVARLPADSARVLQVEEGSPVLLLHRLFMGIDGTPLAYARLFGGDGKYKLQTEFERIR